MHIVGGITSSKARLVMAVCFGAAAVAGLGAVSSHAQQPEPGFTLTLDKGVYFLAYDEVVVVSIAGATECAGQEVRLGIYRGPVPQPPDSPPSFHPGPEDSTAAIVVDAQGNASATVPLLERVFWPGVEGDCISGGRYVHDRRPDGSYIDPVPPQPRDLISEKSAYREGEDLYLYVAGIGPCAGQTVQMGIFTSDGTPLHVADVTLDGYGRGEWRTQAVASLPEQGVLGIAGSCHPGSLLLDEDVIRFGVVEQVPVAPTPKPPAAGTGAAATEANSTRAWPAGIGLVVVALLGAMTLGRRRASR